MSGNCDLSCGRCPRCGFTSENRQLNRNCGKPPPPPPGLGDMVAAGLSAIGITKERVEAVVGGPCGCSERQGYINAAAAKWLGMPPGSTAPPEIDPPTP